MMLITPIASAFDHCSGMDETGHLSESRSLTVIVSVKDATLVNQKGMINGDNSNPVDMDCHTNNSCTFHACGITSSVPTVNPVISLYFSYFEYFSVYDTDLSPGLRPPIIVL